MTLDELAEQALAVVRRQLFAEPAKLKALLFGFLQQAAEVSTQMQAQREQSSCSTCRFWEPVEGYTYGDCVNDDVRDQCGEPPFLPESSFSCKFHAQQPEEVAS